MKVHIIQLEPHDDLVSVRDKMVWSKSSRILLVWPKVSAGHIRPFDLTIIRRQAVTLGAELGLVTQDRSIRIAARKIGVSVFQSTKEAMKGSWLRGPAQPEYLPRRKPDLGGMRSEIRRLSESSGGKELHRLLIFSMGVMAVLVLVILLVPSAHVELDLEKTQQSLQLAIKSDPSISNINLSGNIPARKISVVVEGRDSVSATGTVSAPDAFAQGFVEVRNLTDRPVFIPSGTVVSTAEGIPVRFFTLEEATLEPVIGAETSVRVQAIVAGSTGNLPAGILNAVEGNLGLSVSVNNNEPVTGGTDRIGPIPTVSDRINLHQNLLSSLRESAIADLNAQLLPGDILYVDTLEVSRVLEERFEPAEGERSNRLSLAMQVEFSAYFGSNNDLTELSTLILDASLPDGYQSVGGSLAYSLLRDPVTDASGTTRFQLQISRSLVTTIDEAGIARALQGRMVFSARDKLEHSGLIQGSATIRQTPGWWPVLPILPFRIAIIY